MTRSTSPVCPRRRSVPCSPACSWSRPRLRPRRIPCPTANGPYGSCTTWHRPAPRTPSPTPAGSPVSWTCLHWNAPPRRSSTGTRSSAPPTRCATTRRFNWSTPNGRCTSLVTSSGADEAELRDWLRRESNRPFNLQTGPVFRLSLLRRNADEHVLVLAVHHIAVDFWSIDVMLDELRLLYAAEHGVSGAAADGRSATSTTSTGNCTCSKAPRPTGCGTTGAGSWPVTSPTSSCPSTAHARRRRRIVARCTASPSTPGWARRCARWGGAQARPRT